MAPVFRSRLLRSILVLAFALASVAGSSARHHHHQSQESTAFDYYVLSLSWAPTYCSEHPGDHSSECRTGEHKTFVLHGLWPQAESGPPPMSCAPARPVAADLVDYMLQYFPSRGLIQHEWEEHGTCSGLSAQDYFHQAEQAYRKIQLPEQLRSLNREQDFRVSDIERGFAEANHAAAEAVRISCHNRELVNVEICLSKDLQFRACSPSVRDCPANEVSLLPAQ